MTIEKNQEITTKHFVTEIDTKSIDEDNRIVNVIVSSEKVDRDGDIIKVQGISLKSFKKNPTVLWSHNSYEPSVIQATDIQVDTNKKQLLATVKFAKNDAEADKLWNLVKQKFIRTVSIGFRIIEQRFAGKRDKELYGEKVGRIINKSEMIECSFVNIPSNTDAIITAIHKGIISKELAKEFFPEIKIESEQIEEPEPILEIDIDSEPLEKDIKEALTTAEKTIEEAAARTAIKKGLDKKEVIEPKENKKEEKVYTITFDKNKSYAKEIYTIEVLKKKGQIIYK